ncbi:MAG TPA: SAF domain-containing protein [Solirubrobacterales bacterium]|nr:SAF domain-containing protein [Solirubrobacterales bacterium]
MSRRGRAIGFLLAALLAAFAAAAVADGYGERVARGYGELRPVLVTTASLGAGHPIDPETAARSLDVRRVPAAFAPPDSLRSLPEAVGLVPAAPLPAGSYLLAAQLRPPRTRASGPRLGRGRRPVEIAVGGAGALLAAGMGAGGGRVDVVVTTEPSGSTSGRTYVAAAAVPLLALAPETVGEAGETSTATLGLTRPQALRLIDAESFARRVTVIPSR